MPRHKGTKKTGGRKKGQPNKVTRDARDAMEQAFLRLEYAESAGGVDSLAAWATDNPDKFYALWARLIPQQQVHSGDPEQPIRHAIVKWGDVEIPI